MLFLSIFFAIISVLSYTYYSRCYQPIMETSNAPATLSATILYMVSSVILISLVGLTTLIWQDSWANFQFPKQVELWWFRFADSKDFGVNILLSMIIMSFFYAIHIITEAKARKAIDMNIYSILFQVNSVFIVLGNHWFTPIDFTFSIIVTLFLVLIFSVFPLFYRIKHFDKQTILIGIISAFTCGIALVTDGKMVERLIFTDKTNFNFHQTPIFLFYEFLTFFIPSVITFFYLILRLGFNTTLKMIRQEYLRQKNNYQGAALGSVFQFVGGVYALGTVSHSILPTAILATTSLIKLLYSTFKRDYVYSQKFIITIYTSAFIVVTSLIILSLQGISHK